MKRLLGISIALLLPLSLKAYAPSGWAWASHNMPVFYEINQNGTPDCDGEFEAIQGAFETWENVSTSWIDFTYAGLTSRTPTIDDGYCTIAWVESGWTSLPENPSYKEVSVVYVQESFGVIYECDQYFNGEYWNWSTTGQSNRFDVENVAAHEAGHWVGLASLGSAYSETTMYDVLNYQETKKRDLHSDDIAGASFLYPYQVDWPPELEAVYYDPYHHFSSDVALAWDPTGKDEYYHVACVEGQYLGGFGDSVPDTLLPLDSMIWPVRVVYGHNNMVGWSQKDILSGYHNVISGPELVTDENDNQHIIWTERDGTSGNVVYNRREQGNWYGNYTLSAGVVDWPRSPAIAVQHAPSTVSPHSGNVYTAWLKKVGNQDVLMFRRCVNGSWYASEVVSSAQDNGSFSNVDLAIDSTGGVHLIWREEEAAGSRHICWMKNNNAGASGYWGTKYTAEHALAGTLSAAIDGYGNVHIAYVNSQGPNLTSINYDRITNLGNGSQGFDWQWDSMGTVSPTNVRAIYPRVVCDNLGFVHFFWNDNRDHAGAYNFDVFYRRNFHMGDDYAWDPKTNDFGDPGIMIYRYCPIASAINLGDVAQPDTFGDMFVGIDVWPNATDNWDIYATLGRQDDLVRNFPWPPQQSAPFAAEEEASLDIKPQGCYLSGSLNRLFYFAPAEAQLSCYSIDGRRVHEQKIKGADQLELNFLPSGTYFAHLKSTDGSSSRTKIVVVH